MFPARVDPETSNRAQVLNQVGHLVFNDNYVPAGAINEIFTDIDIYKHHLVQQADKDEDGLIYKRPLKMPTPRSMTNGLILRIKNLTDLNLFETTIRDIGCENRIEYRKDPNNLEMMHVSCERNIHLWVLWRLVKNKLLSPADPTYIFKDMDLLNCIVCIKTVAGNNLRPHERREITRNPERVVNSDKYQIYYNPHLPVQRALDRIQQFNDRWSEQFYQFRTHMWERRDGLPNIQGIHEPLPADFKPEDIYGREHLPWIRLWKKRDQFQIRKEERSKYNSKNLSGTDLFWDMSQRLSTAQDFMNHNQMASMRNFHNNEQLRWQLRNNGSTAGILDMPVPRDVGRPDLFSRADEMEAEERRRNDEILDQAQSEDELLGNDDVIEEEEEEEEGGAAGDVPNRGPNGLPRPGAGGASGQMSRGQSNGASQPAQQNQSGLANGMNSPETYYGSITTNQTQSDAWLATLTDCINKFQFEGPSEKSKLLHSEKEVSQNQRQFQKIKNRIINSKLFFKIEENSFDFKFDLEYEPTLDSKGMEKKIANSSIKSTLGYRPSLRTMIHRTPSVKSASSPRLSKVKSAEPPTTPTNKKQGPPSPKVNIYQYLGWVTKTSHKQFESQARKTYANICDHYRIAYRWKLLRIKELKTLFQRLLMAKSKSEAAINSETKISLRKHAKTKRERDSDETLTEDLLNQMLEDMETESSKSNSNFMKFVIKRTDIINKIFSADSNPSKKNRRSKRGAKQTTTEPESDEVTRDTAPQESPEVMFDRNSSIRQSRIEFFKSTNLYELCENQRLNIVNEWLKTLSKDVKNARKLKSLQEIGRKKHFFHPAKKFWIKQQHREMDAEDQQQPTLKEKIAIVNRYLIHDQIKSFSHSKSSGTYTIAIQTKRQAIKFNVSQSINLQFPKVIENIKQLLDVEIPPIKNLRNNHFITVRTRFKFPVIFRINYEIIKNENGLSDSSYWVIPFEDLTDRQFLSLCKYVDEHAVYFQPLLTFLGLKNVELWERSLQALKTNSSRFTGQAYEKELVEYRDYIEDEKVDAYYKIINELGIDNVPTNRLESQALKNTRRLCGRALKLIQKQKRLWAPQYRITADIAPKSYERRFKKRKHNRNYEDPTTAAPSQETEPSVVNLNTSSQHTVAQRNPEHPDSFDSMPSLESVGSLQNDVTEEQVTNTEPFNYWLDCEPVHIERTRPPENYFTEEISAETAFKQEKSQNDFSKTVRIMYANIPCSAIWSNKNIFQLLINLYPEIKIFALVELYWSPASNSVAPPNWTFVTHIWKGPRSESYSGFLIENTVDFEQIEENKICTHIRLKSTVNKPIDLFAYYRSPTPNCKVYEKMYPEGGGAKKFHTWFMADLVRIYEKYEDAIVFTDANLDLWRTPPIHQLEKTTQTTMREILLKQWTHLTDGIKTCWKSEQGSTVDWILTKQAQSVINFQAEDNTLSSIKFDHVLFSFEINCSAKQFKSEIISVKSKVPKNLTVKQAEQFVDPINRAIMRYEIEEMAYKEEHGIRDWNGRESYLENEELSDADFALTNPTQEESRKRKLRRSWRKMISNRVEFFQRISMDFLPMKTIRILPERRNLQQRPAVQQLLQERKEYMEMVGIIGTGRMYSNNDHMMKYFNNRITKQLDKEQATLWRNQLNNSQTNSDFWQLLKKYRKKNSFDPSWMVRHGIAKGFEKLTWDYTSKNKPLPIWSGNEVAIPRFLHEPLDISSQNFYKNPIMMLRNGKRSRYCYSTDGVTWDMVRNLNLNSWYFLTQIYNEILKTGHYHQSMREHKLLAIKKKDPPPDYSKLRPVSVSNETVNDVEQINTIRYYHHCETNQIFDDRQCGFRSNYCIGYLISELRKTVARRPGKLYSVLLTDLSNAFGSSDTEIILEKFIDDLGKQEFKLIKSFLTQSRYRVRYENMYAKEFIGAPRGFTQGSKFSPTGYIREMLGTHERLTADAFTFADDAQFVQFMSFICGLIAGTLRSMEEFDGFCQDSNIPLNVSKCEVMNSTGKDLKIIYKGMKIPHKNEARMLGFRLNNHLANLPQIRYLNSKLPGLRIMITGFGQYGNEYVQGRVVQGHVMGPFNHANAYDYQWNLNQYSYHQTQINNILQTQSAWRAVKDAKNNKIEDRRIRRVIVRMAQSAEKRFKEGRGSRNIRIPIYYLLKRNGLMTIMNIHRANWQSRGHKILITARPVVEYRDIIRHFVDPIFDQNQRLRRRAMDFPYFRMNLREDSSSIQDLIQKTNPTLFIKEFRRTRATFNDYLGNKKAIKMVKEFYKQRCQHTEWTRMRCDNCNRAEDEWRNDTRRTIRVELQSAMENDIIQEMILENGEWVPRTILEEDVNENTILIQDFEDRITSPGDNSLLSNLEVVQLLERFQGRLRDTQ